MEILQRFNYTVSCPPIGGEILLYSILSSYWLRDSITQYPVLLLAERFYYTLYPVLSLVESMQIEEGELVHGGERQVGKRTCWVAGGQKSRVAGVSAPGVGSSVRRRGREA